MDRIYRITKAFVKNTKKTIHNPAKRKADSFAVYVINSWYRSNGPNKIYTHVHMCWLYDKFYRASTCNKREMLLLWNPFLPFIASIAFLDYEFRHLSKKKTNSQLMTHEANIATCQIAIFKTLMRYTCTSVSTKIMDIIEETNMESNLFVQRISALHKSMSHRSQLNGDSILCPKSPFICMGYTIHGICPKKKREIPKEKQQCSGRHLCLTEHCRNVRSHPTIQCNHGQHVPSNCKTDKRTYVTKGPMTKV